MINDLKLPLPVSQFVDDKTVTKLVTKSAGLSCKMQYPCNELVQWSEENKLNINTRKTKEKIMGQRCNSQVTPEREDVERVTKFKLLGVIVNQSLKWNDNIMSVQRKANFRIYFLNSLKKVGRQTDDLVLFFESIILPMLEYASAVWHSSLTQDQSSLLEAVQKTVMRIIYDAMSYKDACYIAKLMTLEERRRQTANNFVSKCKTARTFYIIYSHHYNVLRLDILSRVNLFTLTQTDLKLLFLML